VRPYLRREPLGVTGLTVPAWPGVIPDRPGAAGHTSWAVPVGVLLASRALVLLGGLLGVHGIHPPGTWRPFDPAGTSLGFGSLGNVLAGPAVRWDALWYLKIAAHGYSSAGSTIFFPVYPLLIRLVGTVTGSAVVAGGLISAVSFAVALVLLYRLTVLELGARAARATVILLALAPLSFFFTALYTESLFLALGVGAAYAARRERWALAGVLGGLAAATRVTGVLLLVLALLPSRTSARGGAWREPRRAWLLLVPAGLGAYLGFLKLSGYGILSPFTGQAARAHAHQFVGPLVAVGQAVAAAGRAGAAILQGSGPVLAPRSLAAPFSPGAESVYLLVVLAVAVWALIVCFRRLPAAYGAFALLALLLAISSPVAGQPLKSLDRYALTIFPLWMAAGAWLSERRLLVPVAALSAGLLLFFSFSFSAWTFVA
jgi:hypothetical protein